MGSVGGNNGHSKKGSKVKKPKELLDRCNKLDEVQRDFLYVIKDKMSVLKDEFEKTKSLSRLMSDRGKKQSN